MMPLVAVAGRNAATSGPGPYLANMRGAACRATLGWLVTVVLCWFAAPPVMAEVLVDGVPLPANAVVADDSGSLSDVNKRFSGAWVGSWGDTLKHILVVERLSPDRGASVTYAVGDLPSANITRSWNRIAGRISGDTLTISSGFTATYRAVGSTLRATFERGAVRSQATMSRVEVATLLASGENITWSKRQVEFLNTDLIENGKPVRLEVVLFKPEGEGPSLCSFSITVQPVQVSCQTASREHRGILA